MNKQEKEIIKALSGIFEKVKNPISPKNYLNISIKDLVLVDNSSVVMIRPISQIAVKCFRYFIEKDFKQKREWLNLYYNEAEEGFGRFSLEYLKPVIDIFHSIEYEGLEKIDILVKGDMPMTLKNKHFEVIIAPCVRN